MTTLPTPNRVRRVLTAASALTALSFSLTALAQNPAPATPSSTSSSTGDETIQLEAVTTLGSRFEARTTADSLAPVDVITASDIHNNGYSELATELNAIVPSMDFPRPSNTDGTDSIRPATLRGLGPGETLVLVDGKRYHTSALVNLNGSVGRGDAAVDLNTIPGIALDGIEILRDGASSQYGSDAIAGVIDLHLRRDIGFSYEAEAGKYYAGDGAMVTGSADWGVALPKNGFVNVSLTFRDSNYTSRYGGDARQQYFGTSATTGLPVAPGANANQYNGIGDPRELTFKRKDGIFGDPVSHSRGLFVNSELPLTDNVNLYFFGGANDRHNISFASWRRPADSTNVRSIYPNGFQPEINPHVADYNFTVGANGTYDSWKWDLSETYGLSNIWYYTINSVNVTYGNASPTRFYDGELSFNEWTTNLDLTKEFEVGLPSPIKTAIGGEYRADEYLIKQGDHQSWDNGGQLVLDGPSTGATPAYGAQGFPGFRPEDQTDSTRENIAGYVDFENQVTKNLDIDIAGRAERYNDAGSTVTGKISGLYKLTKWLNLRGDFSNGFRAPQLAQEYFTTTSTVILTVNGTTGPYEVKTFQVGNPAAVALGATPLKPERSTNASAGFTLSPNDDFTTSFDWYDIGVSNRIVLSSSFASTSVANYLAATAPGIEGGRYFTNGVDTRTQGFDITSSYGFKLKNGDKIKLTAGYNYNDTIVTWTKATPAAVLALTSNQPIFDRQAILRFERGSPMNKFVSSVNYDYGSHWSFLVREDWYGKILSAGAWSTSVTQPLIGTSPTDQWFNGEFITDAEVAYHWNKRLTVAVGGNNVFNIYPNTFDAANNTSGSTKYSSFSPFGFDGGFWYVRVSGKF